MLLCSAIMLKANTAPNSVYWSQNMIMNKKGQENSNNLMNEAAEVHKNVQSHSFSAPITHFGWCSHSKQTAHFQL